MRAFRARVVSQSGTISWRKVDAPNADAAAARLLVEGLIPLDIYSGTMGLAEFLQQPIHLSFGTGIGEQALILTQLALLIRSGLPVDRALDLLQDQAGNARRRALLAKVLDDVRAGTGLAQAFDRRNLLPGYAIGVIGAAEQTGRLGEALSSLAERMTWLATTRREIVTTLTYPAAVLAATMLALGLVLTIVVPQFEPTFAGQEAKLPALTQAVLGLSALVRDYGLWLMALAIALVAAVVRALQSSGVRNFLLTHRRYVPGIDLREQFLAAQFTGILAALLANRITLVSALPLAATAMGSARWRAKLGAVSVAVREGTPLSHAMAKSGLLPHTVLRLVEVGEKTATLAQTCARANEILADTSRSRINRIVSLASPIAIVLLGGLVAMLMAGVMLGIFAIGDFAV